MTKHANVYIDGFNLYYGALKGTRYKWLDLEALSARLVSGYSLHRVRYFTARVSARPGNPDAPKRQGLYLRALATSPRVSIHYGRFLETRVRAALCRPVPGGPRTVEVFKTEEKGTDVNIATMLLNDAFRGDSDLYVVVSNDADLAAPIRLLITELGVPVGLVNPGPSRARCRDLARLNTLFFKQVQTRALAQCQLPAKIDSHDGTINRPERWRGKSNGPVT
jgi:hypothetical protein